MIFYSFFKTLIGKDVVIELKNDLNVAGTLHSVDQYLNFKLTDITVIDAHVSHLIYLLYKFNALVVCL